MRRTKRLWSMLLAMLMAFSVATPILAADDTDYDDVMSTDWYASAAKYMKDAGLMGGMDGGFNANGTFTRAQLATVLYRMAGSPPVTGEDTFPDTNPDA